MTPNEARSYVRLWVADLIGSSFSDATEQVLDRLGDRLSEHVDGLERAASQSEIHQAHLRGQLRGLQDLLVEAARGLVLADVTAEKELVSARIPLKTAKKMREVSRPLMIEQGMEDFGVEKPERFQLFGSSVPAPNILERLEHEFRTEATRQGVVVHSVGVMHRDGKLTIRADVAYPMGNGPMNTALLQQVMGESVSFELRDIEEWRRRARMVDENAEFKKEFMALWSSKES